MRLLFDQGTPRPLGRYLTDHEVRTTAQMGWAGLGGLAAAEEEPAEQGNAIGDQVAALRRHLE